MHRTRCSYRSNASPLRGSSAGHNNHKKCHIACKNNFSPKCKSRLNSFRSMHIMHISYNHGNRTRKIGNPELKTDFFKNHLALMHIYTVMSGSQGPSPVLDSGQECGHDATVREMEMWRGATGATLGGRGGRGSNKERIIYDMLPLSPPPRHTRIRLGPQTGMTWLGTEIALFPK